MNFKINKYIPLGLLLIVLGMSLYVFSGIDEFIRPFTQPILMGSSKGKDILFFVLFGITIILSCICDNERIYSRIKSLKIPDLLKNRRFYLKLSLVLFLFTAIMGLAVELYLRHSLGIGYNTIFVAMKPTYTTTSFLHSHLYKSLFGVIIGALLTYIPAGIHTGSSLSTYTPQIINILFILIPINYLLMICSLQRQKVLSRLFLAFTSTIGIIGIIDGGMFATPTVGGIYGILILLYNNVILDEISDYISRPKDERKEISLLLKEEWDIIKAVFTGKIRENKAAINKYLKIALPHIALAVIIILRFSIAFYGADTECYELTVSNGEDLDLSEYDTLNITEYSDVNGNNDNRTVVHISNEYNEMELLNNLTIDLNGKCDWYSLSWNIYSYI